jgi:imidazolonepropionase-like amidohydrolase
LALTPSVAWAQEKQTELLLTGAKVLDPAGRTLLEGYHVLIAGDGIAKVAPAAEVTASAAARSFDLSGLTLVPGLIDAHSHLLLYPYDETSWNDQVLKESLELRTVRAVAAAKAALEAGFTTLRDMGTAGAGYADVALRDAIAKGIVPGPRVFASTRALVATGCYGPMGFDPRWDVPKGAQVADGVDGVRKAVRQQIAAGADWIKVYADYRRKPGARSTPTYSQEELNAIVDEARSAGLPVAAHATINEAIRRSVLAGVASVEHGSNASEEALTLMREHEVVLCPTLAASEAIARYAGWEPGTPDPPRIKRSKEMFARALKSGVTIACGSDVGVFAHGDNVRELELMVAYGMSPGQALRAATITAAQVLDRQDDLGRIAKGYLADVVAIRGNPLEDPSSLRNVVMVLKDGRTALDRR